MIRLNRVDLRHSAVQPTRLVAGEGAFHGMCKSISTMLDSVSYSLYDTYNYQGAAKHDKVDIVNEVSKIADITKVKAEVAVDAVFDAMRLSMQRGERIELRGLEVPGSAEARHRPESQDRQGSSHPTAGTHPVQPGKDLQNIGG